MPSLRNSSSPLNSSLKKLYLAQSIKELNGFIDKSMAEVNRSEPTAILKSLVKSYEEAKKELRLGDEERAYLLFMRTVNAYMKVKEKCASRKDIYYEAMFSQNKVKECVDCSEKLIQSLERRYEALQESNKVTNSDSDSLNNNSSKIVNSAAEEPQANDPITNNLILCTELYELMNEFNKANNDENSVDILLIDVRSSQDFNESHLKLDKFKLLSSKEILLNVPENLLEPGLTISRLEKSLPPQTVTALKNRRSAKKVILFDWSSKSLNGSNKLDALFFALWKWDKTSERSKSIPLILKGGYEEWLLTYPTLTTNVKVSPPKRVVSSPDKKPAINFDEMMALIEDKPVDSVQKPEVNGFSETTEESNYRKNFANKMSNLLPDNPNIKAPGSAKTVPMIDRSKKPAVSEAPNSSLNDKHVNDSSLTSELLRLKKQKEAEEEMKKSLQQQEEAQRLNILRLEEENRKKDEDMKILREENVTLKRNFKPSSEDGTLKLNSVVAPKASSSISSDESDRNRSPVSSKSSSSNGHSTVGGDENRVIIRKSNEVRPTTERTMSESSGPSLTPKPSNILSVNSNLSRSHSSPNIAQLLEEESENNILSKSRSTTNPPQFDRTLKPNNLVNDFTPNKPLSASVARSRNFSPIYGISGQAITGLRNLGNTCFMNSVIQCLSSTIDLAIYCNQERYLQDINKHSKFGSKGEIAEEFAVLVRQMWTCQYKSLAPKDFKLAVGNHLPMFVGCDQQDAHEFLVMLLEKLHADLNRGKSDGKAIEIKDDIATHLAIKAFWNHHVDRNCSIISELFEGLLLSTLTCSHCGKVSNSFEVFSCLSLPIPTNNGHRCNLLDCLKLFSEPERMSGEAAWDCPTCKTKREAVKKITICRLPRVLLIHLKRFSYEGMWRQKLQTSIEFPLTDLSLKNYRYVNQNDVSQQLTYDLYGVVNHYGTLEGGHYTSFCKNVNTKKWYKFDDHEVSEMTSLDVKTQAAYILFYTATPINT